MDVLDEPDLPTDVRTSLDTLAHPPYGESTIDACGQLNYEYKGTPW